MSSMFTWVDFAEDAAAKTGGLPDSRNLNQGTGQVRRKHNSSLSQDRIPLPWRPESQRLVRIPAPLIAQLFVDIAKSTRLC